MDREENTFAGIRKEIESERIPRPTIFSVNNSQFHFGPGDNVGGDKLAPTLPKRKTGWLGRLAAIATILALVFGIYTYFFPLNESILQPDKIVTGNNELPVGVIREEPILIRLTYQPPKLAPSDQCGETCIGSYSKIGEDANSLYLDSPACTSSRVVGYNFDSLDNDEILITHWQVEEKKICDWIAVPKPRILSVVKFSNASSTIKTVPNYKVFE